MHAVHLHSIHDLRLTDLPDPVPAPGEVMVQVQAAGICGTDRHLFHGTFPARPPVTLCHEFAGVISALGKGVTSLKIGDLITCDPNIACGLCPQCLSGRVNLCRNLTAIGVHRNGGFAPLAAIPAHRALILPVGTNPQHGAFCEPLACCLHGLDLAQVKPGHRVIVLGGGVIGRLCLQLANLAGAEVMLITRAKSKQDLGLSLGAAHAVADADQARLIWPGGADVVLECAGVTETMTAAPSLTAIGGTVVILGVLGQGQSVGIEPFDLLVREIRMQFAFLNPFTQSRAASLIGAGKVLVAPLISRVISLVDTVEAIRNPAHPNDVKVLVQP